MGILNITPDSFYDGGRYLVLKDILQRAGDMLNEGADIIDVGAASSRPGAAIAEAREEQKRLLPVVEALTREFPEAILSIDTYNADTARKAINAGAHIINDISAGSFDKDMFATIASLKVPYIIMHMKGTPATMQDNPVYNDLIHDVISYFSDKLHQLQQLSVHDVVIDPGFGFGKTLKHNYQLLGQMDFFRLFERPILVGLSRKSMVNKVLKVKPEAALFGTTVMNTLALTKGACMLRVHDVKVAKQVVALFMACRDYNTQLTDH